MVRRQLKEQPWRLVSAMELRLTKAATGHPQVCQTGVEMLRRWSGFRVIYVGVWAFDLLTIYTWWRLDKREYYNTNLANLKRDDD